MLPTTGFFKDIDCPYYESACGRPYCHFRHRKKNQEFSEDSQDSTEQTQEVPTYNPTPKSQLQNVRSHIPISYVPDIVVRTERSFRTPPVCSFNSVTYNPTPLSELSKNRSNSTNADGQAECFHNENATENVRYNNDDIDFGDDIDLTSECALIDDIINEKNDENIENCESNKPVDKKAPDKSESKIVKEKERTSTKKDDKSKSKSSSSKPEKSSKSESKDKSKHRDDSGNKEHKSSSSKSNDKKGSKTHESKRHKEHSQSSHKHKDSNKNHRKDKPKVHDDKKHKSKDKEKSKDHHREKSTRDKKNKHDSKHKGKSKSKEKDREKKKSESEGDEKIALAKEITSEENNFNEFDIFIDDDDDLNNPSLEEECYRIFNEYKPEPINPPDASKESQIVQEYIPTPKKRIAHQGAENMTTKTAREPSKPSQNPALAMLNRFKVVRQAHANNEQKNIVSEVKSIKRLSTDDDDRNTKILKTAKEPIKDLLKEKPKKLPPSSLIDDIINGSSSAHVPKPCDALMKTKVRRIAPVQNVYSIQQAKAKIVELTKRNAAASKTPMQTISKGSKRVAHIPDMSMGDMPDVLQPESKKIPLNIRTRYLTLLADECLKMYLLKQDAYERALNEEVKVMERCSAIVTYRNSAMLSVNRVRKELQEREAKGLGPISPDDVDSDEQNSPFKGKQFYQNISTYLLTDEELDIHGYPKEGPVPGKAIIKTQKLLPKVNLNSNQRLCCRCFKVYIVDDKGFPVYEEICQYHPLKKRTIRGDRIYLCCKTSEDAGCATASTHVCETEAELEGYQTTMVPSSEDDPRSQCVYALDCEMCYTTKGLELTRVTIVDPDCKTVYESLVKPLHPIIDYNTQFSGITKEQMDKTSTSILQVQANILHLCNSKTILIGHSLESDMKALKIIHTSIIDTSVLFPHRLGLPHKKALRVLASEFLKKIIQNDINGHDSAEDALTCMELVIWKLKEDMKTRTTKM